MTNKNFYSLPDLLYAYDALSPVISEQQLMVHHTKHHQSYVDGANALLKTLDDSRRGAASALDIKAILKSLSFNIAGHILHSLFWENLTPSPKKISDDLQSFLLNEFQALDNFKKEFSQAAITVEGSGWACLAICPQTSRPLIVQIEKHNVNVLPGFAILMVLDVFEHAYYLDYKNERSRYVENFWQIINWDKVSERLSKALSAL